MRQRLQRTIQRPVETSGIGFLTGADVKIRFLPAEPNHGIAFQRVDRAETAPIPARLEYTLPQQRRTTIAHRGIAVDMIEHVMAALAGLQVDNCLVQLDAPEPPGFDGSCHPVVDCLLNAGLLEQDKLRPMFVIENDVRISFDNKDSEIVATPSARKSLTITYHLDYGLRSPISPQNLTTEITPETFVNELSTSRTFVLESEVESLRAQGYGCRTTAKDLLVFGRNGVIDNQLRTADECVRHKILDCVGDFALIGHDIVGHFNAYRSGHRHNLEIIRRLQLIRHGSCVRPQQDAA